MGYLIICWQIIYIPLAFFYFKQIIKQHGGLNIRSILIYIVDFFYPGYTNANGWGQSWYLIAMLIAVPLFLAIYRLSRENIIPLVVISIFFEIYYILANEFGFITHLPKIGTLYFPRLFIYILIGFFINKYYCQIFKYKSKSIFIIFIVILFIFIIENITVYINGGLINSEEVITTAPTATLFAILGLKINPSFKYSTKSIRNFSTFLYCVQNWPRQIIIKLCGISLNSMILEKVYFFFAVVTFSLILFVLYKKIKEYSNIKFLKYFV